MPGSAVCTPSCPVDTPVTEGARANLVNVTARSGGQKFRTSRMQTEVFSESKLTFWDRTRVRGQITKGQDHSLREGACKRKRVCW